MLKTIKENISFLGICLLVFAGLLLIAFVAEKLQKNRKINIAISRRVAYMGIFAALAGVLMLVEIPLFFAPNFYKIDLSEIPVLICTFSMGPVAGVICELIKIIVKLLLKGTTTAFVGDFANFAVGCSMVLPASIIYCWNRTKKGAIIALSVGGIIMTVFGSIFNAVYLLPAFSNLYGIPLDAIVSMGTQINSSITSVTSLVILCVVPFNLLKAVLVSIITMFLYKRVKRLIKLK